MAGKQNLSDSDIAYIAGFVDGDGCIAYNKTKHKNKSRFPNPTYSIQCIVTNKHRSILEWFKELFSGTIRDIDRIHCGKREIFSIWLTSGDTCRRLLGTILPYLKVKRKQAELVLAFKPKRKVGRKRLTKDELENRERLYQQIRKLNS